MATISVGFDRNFNLPNVGITMANAGCQYALVSPAGYGSMANLKFTGSTRPNIFITTQNLPTAWAVAWIYSKGRGKIAFSNNDFVLAAYVARYPTQEARQQHVNAICAHELGHIVVNTKDERVGIPLIEPLLKRLIKLYGPPKVRSDQDEQEPVFRLFAQERWHWKQHLRPSVVIPFDGD